MMTDRITFTNNTTTKGSGTDEVITEVSRSRPLLFPKERHFKKMTAIPILQGGTTSTITPCDFIDHENDVHTVMVDYYQKHNGKGTDFYGFSKKKMGKETSEVFTGNICTVFIVYPDFLHRAAP